ncbi:MAG: class I tRNA ligase family protein, partial [Bacillota bacterium]
PAWGEERMSDMISDRTDWCISRQKKWGVPLPIFYCDQCGEAIINEESIGAVKELFAREGSGAWYQHSAEEILPGDYSCPHCGGREFTREEDIMDVWFDSGSSHKAVLEVRENLSWPAQVYLEGTDQYRGWFNSSLLTAVATEGKPPYREVVTNGFTVDDKGNKMSKSEGNVISPDEVIDEYGADILRLWVASSNFKDDVRVSREILKQNAEVYRRVRNTFRFILGNIGDFDPEGDYIDFAERQEIDRWIIIRLQELNKKATMAYNEYEYHRFYHDLHNLCTNEMSSLYADIVKDRLYTEGTDSASRRSVQSSLYDILLDLLRMVAPILVHTAEEVWHYLPETIDRPESVFLTDWPEVVPEYYDQDLMEKWDRLLTVRKDVAKALELARENKIVGNSLDARVVLYPDSEKQQSFLQENRDQLADLFIVSQVEFADKAGEDFHRGEHTGLLVRVTAAAGDKCARCWKYSPTVGQDEEYEDICERCASVVHQGK